MKRKDKGISDQKLQDLTRAVAKLVALTTTEQQELRTAIFDLTNRVAGLELDHTAVDTTTVTKGTQGSTANVTLEDVFVSELEEEEARALESTKPYELRETTNLYVSGDNPFVVARDLIQAAQDQAWDPTFVQLSVAWEAGDEDEGSYFAGNLAAVV